MSGIKTLMVTPVLLILSFMAVDLCLGQSTSEKQAAFDGLIFVTPAMSDDLLLPTTRHPERSLYEALPSFVYRSDKISIFASPGEYEPATFSIYAMTDLQGVKVGAGTLTGDNGSIPAEAVDIRIVKSPSIFCIR